MQIGTGPASLKDILSEKEDVEAKLDELDQRNLNKKQNKTHLRNSSALSAADISVTLPFGICKITKPTHVKFNKETMRNSLQLITKEHPTTAFLHSH